MITQCIIRKAKEHQFNTVICQANAPHPISRFSHHLLLVLVTLPFRKLAKYCIFVVGENKTLQCHLEGLSTFINAQWLKQINNIYYWGRDDWKNKGNVDVAEWDCQTQGPLLLLVHETPCYVPLTPRPFQMNSNCGILVDRVLRHLLVHAIVTKAFELYKTYIKMRTPESLCRCKQSHKTL